MISSRSYEGERRLAALLQHLPPPAPPPPPPPPLPPSAVSPQRSAAASAPQPAAAAALDEAVRARTATLGAGLFDELAAGTHDGVGITRASYGDGAGSRAGP